MDTGKSILLIESDERSAHDVLRFLKVSAYSFSVSHASSSAEAINYLNSRKPDLVLLDAAIFTDKNYPQLNALLHRGNVPVVLLSDSAVSDARKQASSIGATDYIVKNKINLFHLQKTIVTALKINEAEEKLESTLNGMASQHDSFYRILSRVEDGVLVLNASNAVRYANTKAYSILGEAYMHKYLADYVCYRHTETEEQVTIQPSDEVSVTFRVSSINWNSEACNLFIISQQRLSAPQQFIDLPATQVLLDSLNQPLMLVSNDNIIFANKALQQLSGQPPQIFKSLRLIDFAESASAFNPGYSVQSFLSTYQFQGIFHHANGSNIKAGFTSTPLNLEGNLYRLVTVIPEDINSSAVVPAHRGADDAISSEDVLHLASHDLREPVRTILNYVQLIGDKLNESKYEEATEYAQFAKDAASRMERLLSDLKAYIALSTHNFQMSKVSVKIVVNDVLKSMKLRIENAEAQVSVAELPEVSADRELLDKLLSILIDNALKFHRGNRKPIVDIGYDKHEGRIVFCVRDNGIGIAKKYQSKVFDLFERLNRVDEFPGNGLGLAIAKKIVEMHGGEIWIESLPGFGSSFYFTLSTR